jgi:hypothetical protein
MNFAQACAVSAVLLASPVAANDATFEKSAEISEKTESESEKIWGAQIDFAKARLRDGLHDAAIVKAKLALSLAPGSEHELVTRALLVKIYIAAGRDYEAYEAYQAIISTQPDRDEGIDGLVRTLRELILIEGGSDLDRRVAVIFAKRVFVQSRVGTGSWEVLPDGRLKQTETGLTCPLAIANIALSIVHHDAEPGQHEQVGCTYLRHGGGDFLQEASLDIVAKRAAPSDSADSLFASAVSVIEHHNSEWLTMGPAIMIEPDAEDVAMRAVLDTVQSRSWLQRFPEAQDRQAVLVIGLANGHAVKVIADFPLAMDPKDLALPTLAWLTAARSVRAP